MASNTRHILLLAAEDAFEFERWREAGPVTADIDPEVKAAEIAEFEAVGVPMPAELDSLRRELEHAPKIRDAIRSASLALRRSGRASASSLVALGPQQLMPVGPGGVPWGWPSMDPRAAARMAGGATLDPSEPRTRRSRVAAAAQIQPVAHVDADATLDEDGPVDAEVLDSDDDDDDDDLDAEPEPPHARVRTREPERREPAKRRPTAKPNRAARTREDWDEDDGFGSSIAARPAQSDTKVTWILGGVAVVSLLTLAWVAWDKREQPAVADTSGEVPKPVQEPPAQVAPLVQPTVAIDPATGLPVGQAPALVAAPAPAPAPASEGRRGSGVVRSAAAPATSTPVSGGVNPFSGYKTDEVGAKPAVAAAATPPAAEPAPAPAPAPAGEPAPAPAGSTEPVPAPAPTPAPAPAEPPPPEEPQLTKSKMTPAIRQAVIGKVGDLQACYQDAVVGQPDLAGQVVFTISLDQDGVVQKVEIAKDEIKYGVAKCSAKKIHRWNLPSAGIPIIFDLPFDFKA